MQLQTCLALPSAYNIISSNRSIGYSLEAAVADIIDNSISAKATEIEILAFPDESQRLLISDDGFGMSKDKLTEAMTFGGKQNCQLERDIKDLGRFGMGLKTASLSQCKRLEVVSIQNGEINGGAWDLDYLKEHDSWEYIVLGEDYCKKLIYDTFIGEKNLSHGTIVCWSHFDRLTKTSVNANTQLISSMDKVTDKLELIFHRYLEGEDGLDKITISYNGRKLKPNDPFLKFSIPSISPPQKISVNDDFITITPHKLLHPNKLKSSELERLCLGNTLLETQGFYIYRTKRLIDYGTWFGMASKLEKTKLSRIQIDIPNTLDDTWSLDIKKSRAIPPQIIRSELKRFIETTNVKSSKTFTSRTKQQFHKYPYWTKRTIPGNDSIYEYAVNDTHPLIQAFKDKLNDDSLLREFEIIIDNVARFFPFNEIEQDYQQDVKIKNSVDMDIDEKTRENIEHFILLGIREETILTYFPISLEILQKIKSDLGHKKI